MATEQSSTRFQALIVQAWCENHQQGCLWRFRVEDVRTGQRSVLAGFDDLLAHLETVFGNTNPSKDIVSKEK